MSRGRLRRRSALFCNAWCWPLWLHFSFRSWWLASVRKKNSPVENNFASSTLDRWKMHGSGMLHAMAALPKPPLRAPCRVGDTKVSRGNAGWTTSKSGHPCLCQNCSQWPAEKIGRGSWLNRPSSLPPDNPISQRTELNWTGVVSIFHCACIHVQICCWVISLQRGTEDAETEVPSNKNTELTKIPQFKSGVRQNIPLPAFPNVRSLIRIKNYPTFPIVSGFSLW